jgi:hypothetical protein
MIAYRESSNFVAVREERICKPPSKKVYQCRDKNVVTAGSTVACLSGSSVIDL